MKLDAHITKNTASRDQLNALPQTFGIYYFVDKKGDVIYVGKSINIRQRVKSHFSAAKRIEKERKLSLHTVELHWQITAGELSALLLESHEIKRLQPLYNRRLRRRFKQYAWQLDELDESPKPKLVDAVWPPIHCSSATQYGAYKSMSHAQKALLYLVKKHELCAKVLGLESSGNSCFAYQLKQCKGACIGEESLSNHKQRVVEAFAKNLLDEWPFKGLVGVIELASPQDVNLFNGWQYLGTHHRDALNELSEQYEDEHGLDQFAQAQAAHELDRDAYKILLSFLVRQNEAIEILDFNASS